MICKECGKELNTDKIVCSSCGYENKIINNNQKSTIRKYGPLATVAFVFMIIGTVTNALLLGLIHLVLIFIPLSWCIPMTIVFARKIKKGDKVSIAFKICTLLFVSTFAGVFALCMGNPNEIANE